MNQKSAQRLHPGVHRFTFTGGIGSPQFRELERRAAASPLKPTIVPLNGSAYATGMRLLGAAGDANVTYLSNVVTRGAGTRGVPRWIHLSEVQAAGSPGPARVWVRSDASPFEYAVSDRTRVTAVALPIQSLSFDVSTFDLAAGASVDAPPIALHSLRSLAAVATSDVTEWIASSPDAIDRYLSGLTSLILSAIFDERSDLFVEQNRIWLRTRARALIESQFNNPALAPSTIAAKLGVSLRSLHRAFEGEPGVAEELRSRRIEHAATLLREVYCRHLPVHEVSRRSGFTSMATFARTFINTYDIAPTRYRLLALANAAGPQDDPASSDSQRTS